MSVPVAATAPVPTNPPPIVESQAAKNGRIVNSLLSRVAAANGGDAFGANRKSKRSASFIHISMHTSLTISIQKAWRCTKGEAQ